jgi:hypothetical protein
LDVERHLMLRQVRRRFGEAVAAQSAPWLAQITEPMVLEDLGEALLDCVAGAAWLARLDAVGELTLAALLATGFVDSTV